jgi:hypothetical protein
MKKEFNDFRSGIFEKIFGWRSLERFERIRRDTGEKLG